MKDINEYADAELRVFPRPPLPAPDKIKSAYLIGICGTGMGSLAGLLKDARYSVSGSDAAVYPPMSTRLAAMGIQVHEGFDAGHLTPHPDLIVVGNACTPTHVEAAFARDYKLTQTSFPEAVKHFFLQSHKSVVVAGTHGKTTTTGLVTHAFNQLGLEPGYLVGGVLKSTDSSYSIGAGEYFIIEGDEYDSAYFDKQPKFMHYQPHIGIVTSLEYDHVDIYEDFDDYIAAFERFAGIIDPKGTLILNGDDDNVASLAKHTSAKVVTYGFGEEVDIRATDFVASESGQSYCLQLKGSDVGTVSLPMSGKHNILNSLAALGAALATDSNPADIVNSLSDFAGLKRRQEVVLEANGITVIDDFAHHPTAVSETIQAIRQRFPDSRLVAVFEPRSNSSRRKVFQDPYIEAFQSADIAIISSPPFRHNDNAEDFMDIDHVVSDVISKGVEARAFSVFEDLFDYLTNTVQQGDIVLIMSNGGFQGIHQKLSAYITESLQATG